MIWSLNDKTADFTKEHTKYGEMQAMFKADGTVGKPSYKEEDGAMAVLAS